MIIPFQYKKLCLVSTLQTEESGSLSYLFDLRTSFSLGAINEAFNEDWALVSNNERMEVLERRF
jgi:hypothetical protein